MNEIIRQNIQLLQQIVKMHNYLKRYPELKHDGSNFRLQSEVRHGDNTFELEVSPDAHLGILHTWHVSHHNGDYYDFQKKELTDNELNTLMREIYKNLRTDTIIAVQQEAIKEITAKMLKRLGFFEI